jgi:hypothetical protein
MTAVCVHCEQPIGARGHIRYAVSKELAHVKCVSFPSAAQMDELLAIMGSSLHRPRPKKFERRNRQPRDGMPCPGCREPMREMAAPYGAPGRVLNCYNADCTTQGQIPL